MIAISQSTAGKRRHGCIAHPAGETVLLVEMLLNGGFSAMNVKTVIGYERRKVRLIF